MWLNAQTASFSEAHCVEVLRLTIVFRIRKAIFAAETPRTGTGKGKLMSMKLYVGNLSFDTSSEQLQTLFAEAGTVESASVIEDRETGRSRGFGFIEMATKEDG